MIPARRSFQFEFTPVPSCGSVFIYMISTQNLIPERVIPERVHPVTVPERDFHSGTKTHSDVM